jgi:CRP/FNR family transcriptional regulator, cyclic AMP receptor protein
LLLTKEDSEQALDILKHGEWFGGLPARLQELVVHHSIIRTYRKGQYIIREGEATKGIFGVLEGKVRAVCLVGDGNEVVTHVGEAGLWVGQYGMLSGALSIGSIIANSRVRALLLPVSKFEQIVEEEPRYYRAFAALIVKGYGVLFRYLAEANGLVPEEWLRLRLADLAAGRRRNAPAGDPVEISVSQAELATMIGVSRQTISALLARLEARGLIEIGFRTIRVLN